MDRKRKLAMVFATAAVAMGVGHVLQGGLSGAPLRAAGLSSEPSSITPLAAGLGGAPSAADTVTGGARAEAGPRLPDDAMQPADPVVNPIPGATATATATELPEGAEGALDAASVAAGPVATDTATADPASLALSGDSINCPVELQVLASEAASLSLSLIAPCRASERVVIRHGGLAFTAKTSLSGGLVVEIPGMELSGGVSVRFEDGFEAVAAADLPDLPIYQRFAVQWLSNDSFELHAFENGAEPGGAGHVSAANPQRRIAGVPGRGGVLTLLGDDSVALPMLAEVYTWPLDPAINVEVQVETVVSAATCDRELLGELLLSQAGTVEVTDLTMATPACDAIGDVLVLNNPVADMKLALTD
ncbi:MAG: hypothetical protein ACK4GW_07525 [Pseudorhodobacter sp.]